MENSNQQKILNIFNENITISWANGGGEKQGDLNCQFVPDEIQVRASIIPNLNGGNYVIAPNQGLVNNVFIVNSSLPLPTQELCLVGVNNTFNPVYKYVNTSRSLFRGTYNFNVFNLSDREPITAGKVILTFTFIRYANE
jgi:hypothetical protein